MFQLLLLKRWIEAIFIFPFAWWGRRYARKHPLGESYDLFFFFPFYHIGGAEKVNSDIVQQFPDKKIIIFFTRKSVSEAMLPFFKGPNITLKEISHYTDNKKKYWQNLVWRGIVAEYINSQPNKPRVFNGQCNFGYKLSPHVRKDIVQVELIHLLCSFSYIRIPFLPFYDTTVMISQDAIDAHKALYKKFGIPSSYIDKIKLIINGIPLPATDSLMAPYPPLKCLYAGRGDVVQKRVDLLGQLAAGLYERRLPVTFAFMGNMNGLLDSFPPASYQLLGEKSDPADIDRIYRSHHVLVLLSAFEGFPMVVEEAMARGLAIISTPVGDIPQHVKDGVNGFLVPGDGDLVAAAMERVERLLNDPELLARFRTNNITYARQHFGMEAFAQSYRALLT
ncbi:glycosyltransferase family 4 protein [Chitinophaga horti]|uniref:Glycosyltransferase family 4 protein n=1 Tax=Chitinophaga horti TaxID=2920382 RepID=A0ABY6J879_9BACT|nr:glycosyltransferase family 4 protein [Chitinophaga horti]UYQ95895.1 glycosyltransferase family 4 protein [Chitinophaga horti]